MQSHSSVTNPGFSPRDPLKIPPRELCVPLVSTPVQQGAVRTGDEEEEELFHVCASLTLERLKRQYLWIFTAEFETRDFCFVAVSFKINYGKNKQTNKKLQTGKHVCHVMFVQITGGVH